MSLGRACILTTKHKKNMEMIEEIYEEAKGEGKGNCRSPTEFRPIGLDQIIQAVGMETKEVTMEEDDFVQTSSISWHHSFVGYKEVEQEHKENGTKMIIENESYRLVDENYKEAEHEH
ncbi:hypothetical protein L1987_06476 [Smallanthus sonchifolius]|uniref:Uncharacterized protein n=1 Tax=Smallanthus sonchifolius TaxID=185202 RepID=A0ACB9JY72_9ASTR|nr:hypothetical protein L1987_06476 [Smallanthus sonchifolius]